MFGYMGKIVRINLTSRAITTLDTKTYEDWGGGHGIGSAIFFDLAKNKTVAGRDPENIITIMTSPLSGTLAPAVAGRTEMQGIGLQAYPTDWFTRGNVGGRFSGMLKYAGWDGIVIEGRADKPVWIDIRNSTVSIRDAKNLWGFDTWKTQQEIWRLVSDGKGYRNWHELREEKTATGRTTQRPAVMAIGPAGEKLSRIASVIHDAGSAVGQAGFGGVWGCKNLKAISVLGSKSVPIADPKGLMDARLWAKENYAFQINNPIRGFFTFPGLPGSAYRGRPMAPTRPSGCLGCHFSCRRRTARGGNDSSCYDYGWYQVHDLKKHGKETEVTPKAADLIQLAGINCVELDAMVTWLRELHKQGIVGVGKKISTDLPFEKVGEMEFLEQLVRMIEKKEGIGADLNEGLARTAKKWGRLDQDLQTGLLTLQYWGYPLHYDARTQVEWGYGSILGDRDCNEHDFVCPCYWTPSTTILSGQQPPLSAKQLAELIGEKCKPYNDPFMIDYSDKGIYSESMAKTVAWHRHYTRFWSQSIQYCDWAYADFVNPYRPDMKGLTPEAEPKFLNAVTGRNLTFEDSMEIGRKIWNLDRAIWALQGRHRDQEVFAPFTFEVPAVPHEASGGIPAIMPVYENGAWNYKGVSGRKLDRKKFEKWKTTYYRLEGWDPETGWPTAATLESLGLQPVAQELEKQNRLGKG